MTNVSGLVPITVTSRYTTANVSQNGNESNGYISTAYSGYGYMAPIGYGHRGVEDINRVIMSLKSGIDSEVKWALSTLTRISLSGNLSLESSPFIGQELIKYFIKPYQLFVEKKFNKVKQDHIGFSLDSLLTLRNSVQDLHNQQWLAEVKTFKKSIIEVIKFLSNWFYNGTYHSYSLSQYDNQFKEAFLYVLDLLEPLSCYYIDNTKHDPLFNLLFSIVTLTTDKTILISVLKSLSHLLIIRDKNFKFEQIEDDVGDDHDAHLHEEETKEIDLIPNNCIDSITTTQLESLINKLLISDNELNFAILDFIKNYLHSEALHPDYPNSVRDSQIHRLNLLLEINTTKSNYHTLVKQLPLLLLANLPLNDPSNIKPIPQLNLTKRSQFSGVPTTLPELTPDLYAIIVRFPEPLRATTWLRCCYEPFAHTRINSTSNNNDSNSIVVPGEVTQISLWKAYESQFQEIWDTSDGKTASSEYKPLLPAVDFIKNVSRAFPNSEAMVVNLDQQEGDAPPKKKFIIKGIQPRQFSVSIEVGNYEALKPPPISSTNPEENYKLPIGHIDSEKFNHSLNALTESIISDGPRLSKNMDSVNVLNLISYELLDYILTEVLEVQGNAKAENIFRLYNNHWLPDLVYANPTLLDSGLFNPKWLKYFF
ncbi:chromatin remodeling protein [Scheffersomyces amazonensis]|uniref:chromatin remodeling protein n=1 Tax=Scheffersomyces amazonensis TaxID=1078765 RepID=UPI00315D2C35